MSAPITERRRSPWPALMVGTSVFALASVAAWIVAFGIVPIEYWGGPVFGHAQAAVVVLWRVLTEIIVPYTPPIDSQIPQVKMISIMREQHKIIAFSGRVVLAALAGVAASLPIHKWRYAKTPRRLGTVWLGVNIPRWSEGRDAVKNANATFAKAIGRIGRGLEIAPGVFLSRQHEARAILAAGDPGGGKTVFLWQLIFQLQLRPRLMIVHDVKGDITERWPDEKFILLAPQDTRSWGWAIGKDIVGTIAAREFAAALIAPSERAPNWPNGAQEILVGVIRTLQHEKKTSWGWADLNAALDMKDPDLREFACRYNPAASRFMALGEGDAFTLNAGSYVSTLMAPVKKLISPLANAWGDLATQYQISLHEWLDAKKQEKPTLILQRAPDLPELSKGWIGAAVNMMTKHLLATRKDSNPADKGPKLPEVWFLLDEFPSIQLEIKSFLPLLEVGRSLNLRAALFIQNFDQLDSQSSYPNQILQLAGTLVAFNLNPGPDGARICEKRLTKAPVRTWTKKQEAGKTISEKSSEDLPILPQDDLASLEINRDGAQGYLIVGNAAFGLTWLYPNTPKQREGSLRASWVRGE